MSRDETKTRERILRSALDLLEQSRGKNVRMIDIARRAGISRQALYLHFTSKADLFIAATVRMDQLLDMDHRLHDSRTAPDGIGRLERFVDAWCDYIPEIYRIAKPLLVLKETDPEADQAWSKRMSDLREGCQTAIKALLQDGVLNRTLHQDEAVDFLWTLLSVGTWEHLTRDCNWSQSTYKDFIMRSTRRFFIDEPSGSA